MSQCLCCSKLCEPTAVFCEECRSLVRYQLRQGPFVSAARQAQPPTGDDPPTSLDHAGVRGDPLVRMSNPFQSNSVYDEAHPGASLAQPDLVERALHRLNEAARLIEQEEGQSANDRKPRLYSQASRLSPLVERAAHMRRQSTPLPGSAGAGASSALADAQGGLPDDWPWLDVDTQDKGRDIWATRTDPLSARRIPTSVESARIEAEDQRRALEERGTTPFPIPFLRPHASRVRIALLALAVCVLLALLADGLLLSGVLTRSQRDSATPSHGYPTLTLSTDAAPPGGKVLVALAHFPPSTRVVLTHDVQEPISINGQASITTDAQGNATFPLVINTTWGPGFHVIVAEDVASRVSASANVHIIDEGVSRPAHLLIDTTPIDMGADYVGTDTLRSLTLANSGSGSISWSASSDSPWLLVAPSQGIFSQKEVISLAVQRLGLRPGDYRSRLTISSNLGSSERIEVDMSVRALPADAGPVLSLTPALLSFAATDGQRNTLQQTLTVSNPGSRSLQWSLTPAQGLTCPWLGATSSSGTVPAGGSMTLAVEVHSQCLLPGTYSGSLTFRAPGAIDSSQAVTVSLEVQPHCGLLISTGVLAFTVIAGQHTLANQSLSLNATASCADAPIPWSAASSVSWLSVTPGGQFQGTAGSVVTASVNAAALAASPNPLHAYLSFVFGQSTLTVFVQVTVQATPAVTAPLMSVTPLNLNYSSIQGQANPTGQVVTITNNGHSPLDWHVTAQPFPSLVWFAASPPGGSIAVGQSGQIAVNVNATPLPPGTYMGQLTLNGTDAKGNPAAGSPQTVAVDLVVQPPCTLSQPSSSALSFRATQGVPVTPPIQTVLFAGTGSCVWPLSWKTSVAPAAKWLTQTPSSGSIGGTGQSGSIGVGVRTSGLPAGTYSTTVTVVASDSSAVNVQGSTQTFTVTLTVLPPPCVLSPPAPARLTFTAPAEQPSATGQAVTLSETGTCARPVTWTASPNARSNGWLILATPSGSDSGGGSTLGVNVNAAHLTPGTYSGTITITATDSSGASVLGSGRTLSVFLRVTAILSGSVVACPGSSPPHCATPQPLPAATVTLLQGGVPIATTTADASGTYTCSAVAPGSYTISVAGSDASNTHYVGSTALTLTGNVSNVTIQAFPG